MGIQGYPQSVLFLVLGAGLCLAVLRPYMGFLFALLLVTAGHVTMFNQTRIAAVGPYFNLTDACMFVAFVAFFLDKFRRAEPIWLPQIVVLMLGVVTIAAAQSFWKLGWTYESMRAFRWAMQMPAAIFLGANMVNTADRAKKLVAVLLGGALLAAAQHVFFVANIWRTRSLDMGTYQGMRTIGFLAGCMPSAFLVVAILWRRPRGVIAVGLYLATGLLLLASVFLNQTRSLWIGTAAAAIAAILLFRRPDRGRCILTAVIFLALLLFISLLLSQHLLPGLDVVGILRDRADSLFSNEVHMGTRQRAFAIEMTEWLDGSLVLGRGLWFFQRIRNPEDPTRRAAFNHLGYVTYLSQLGIVGLFVYGIMLPFHTLRNGTRLWYHSGIPAFRLLALLGGASIICLSMTFVASSHFLAPGYEGPGVLYGAMWTLATTPANVRLRPSVAAYPLPTAC